MKTIRDRFRRGGVLGVAMLMALLPEARAQRAAAAAPTPRFRFIVYELPKDAAKALFEAMPATALPPAARAPALQQALRLLDAAPDRTVVVQEDDFCPAGDRTKVSVSAKGTRLRMTCEPTPDGAGGWRATVEGSLEGGLLERWGFDAKLHFAAAGDRDLAIGSARKRVREKRRRPGGLGSSVRFLEVIYLGAKRP